MHDEGGGEVALEEGTHGLHVGGCVLEELLVAFAEAAETGLAFGGGGEAVFGTLAVTEEQPAAGATQAGEGVVLVDSETELCGGAVEIAEGVVGDVAEPVLGIDEVVAGIDVAVVLDDEAVATGLAEGAEGGG